MSSMNFAQQVYWSKQAIVSIVVQHFKKYTALSRFSVIRGNRAEKCQILQNNIICNSIHIHYI